MSNVTMHSTIVDLFELPSGRRAYALEAVRAAAKKAKVDIGDALGAAISANEACRIREKAWAAANATSTSSAASAKLKALDGRVDKSVSAIRDSVVAERDDLDPTEDAKPIDRLNEFLDRHFPKGAAGYTKLAYVEEHQAVTKLVADIRKDDGDVVKMLGLERRLARLEELLPKYKAEIDAGNVGASITWKDVTGARDAAHEAFCALVVVVAGRWWTPKDGATRAALLDPIMLQNAKVAEGRKGRRDVEDVDPTTGEPVGAPVTVPVTPPVA